ncbi:protein tadG [Vibrio sp. JCM 19236]|nr:protein tadG [Vibrio sp. JCM 19236]
MRSYKKQKGVAIIVVAMSMVAIGGMAQIAIEGSRMIQEKNRLADAAEAATLAVAIANHSQQSVSDQLARDYLENYLPNIEIERVNVVRKEGSEEYDGNKLYYVQYEVEAAAQFDAQFSFLGSDSGGSVEAREVGNDAMAKTYMLPSDLDLVYIADFSGSMNNKWQGNKTQLDVLKEQVDIISQDLLSSGAAEAGYAHRIGFVPYNLRTQENIGNERRCVTELEYKSAWVNNQRIYYSDIDWYEWGKRSYNAVSNCASRSSNCPSFSTQREAIYLKNVLDRSKQEVNNSSYYRYPDPKQYVDIDATVRNWNVSKTQIDSMHPLYNNTGTNLFHDGMCGNAAGFHSIALSREAPDISSMKADGWTSVYQGLIRGAQMLADGRPDVQDEEALEDYYERAQMLLILSDGQEDPFRSTFTDLVDAGLCTEIRDHFKDHERPLYIGVIGINFNASGQTGFRDCADEIIDVSNSQDLLDKIQELIQKGAATSGVSRLYDKTL